MIAAETARGVPSRRIVLAGFSQGGVIALQLGLTYLPFITRAVVEAVRVHHCVRAGQGAHFCVDIYEDVDLAGWAADFRARNGEVIATVAEGGANLYDARLSGRIAIAIGNEGAGIDAALLAQATQRVTIPMPGGMESLNAAAAAAVCLFECVRQREKEGVSC